MIDIHNHTEYSFDSKLKMEQTIKTAISKNINVLGFSDHLDFADNDPGKNYYNAKKQFTEFAELKNKYNTKIKLLLGIEASYESYYYEKTSKILNDYNFDYTIMSVHFVDKLVMSEWIKTIENGKKSAADTDYSHYFMQMKELIENGDFDILGHIDYYKKYSKFNHSNTFQRYFTIIKEILQILIDKGKTLEINTSGLRYKCNEQFPSNDFLQLYKDLGGTLISVGSDSHKKEHIGFGIDKANTLVTDYKFKHFLDLEETCQE